MVHAGLTLVLAFACQAPGKLERPEALAAPKQDAAKDLKEKAAKAVAVKSYTFELKTEREGGANNGGGGAGGGAGGGRGGASGAGGGGNRGGGGRGDSNTTTLGKYVDGEPVELKRGDLLAYRKGDKLTYLKNGNWELPPDNSGGGGGGTGRGTGGGGSGGGGGGNGGGRGGGAGGGGGGGGRRGGGGGEGWTLMALSGLKLPHELLASIDTKVTDVKESEEAGRHVFVGNLTKESADELSGSRRFREMGAQGGNAPEIKASGTLRIVFTKDDRIDSVVVETKTSSSFGDYTTKQTYSLKDAGTTKVEPPKEALEKLGVTAGSH
jgi:hypothetical protein